MTNKDLTWLVAIRDRSGSMAMIKSQTDQAYDAFVKSQAAEPGECVFTLVDFDSDHHRVAQIDVILDRVPIAEVPPSNLQPRGGTPLLDAIGTTINRIGKLLSELPEDERPANVAVNVLTDGQENASTEFTAEQIAEMIKHQEDVYSWYFQFFGADQGAVEQAKDMGFRATNSAYFDTSNVGGAVAMASASMGTYRTMNSAGASYGATMDAVAIDDEDREALAETDPHKQAKAQAMAAPKGKLP